jgi:hypothetical protein
MSARFPVSRDNEPMSYTTESGRTQILNDAAAAADDLAVAIGALGEAYEHLDDQSAERMEDLLFRPLQAAYGQLKRTHTEFSARHGLPEGSFRPAPIGAPGEARAMLERAADAISQADGTLAELQDSLLPVEVGDQPLRAGLSGVRSLISPLPGRCDQFVRTIGR